MASEVPEEARILVFNGSPRRNGTTTWMIDQVLDSLQGRKQIIRAYKAAVSPCIDCRSCWKKPACAVRDGMQEIYAAVDAADIIIFASPIYFHSIPAPLKMVIDRFQVYWAASLRKDRHTYKKKCGVSLLCGGAPAFSRQFDGAELILSNVFGDINAEYVGMVTISDTDNNPRGEEPGDAQRIHALAGRAAETAEMLMLR
jgi:putative NADPH-quinone reductase